MRKELKQMNKKAMKLTTMHKALHPRDKVVKKRRLHKKTQRKIDYNDQKQYRQHKQQNKKP